MFDKYTVLVREFQNVEDNGRVVGFQLKVRIAYYRGVFLPLIGGFDVAVDGQRFDQRQLQLSIGGRTYTMEELGKEETARWSFGEAATLTILHPGGLKPGTHDVEVVQTVFPGYMPDGFIATFRRKMTLVA